MKPTTITTARLFLRNAHEEDAARLFLNYCSSKESSRFLTREAHKSESQTSIFLNKWCSEAWDNDSLEFVGHCLT